MRLSVGIESIDDILADLDAGFRAAKGSVTTGAGRRDPSAATVPPVTGAWREGDDPGRRQFLTLDAPFALEAGGALPEVRVAYETWGTLAPDASNAVLVLHALTGDSHAAGPAGPGHSEVGWWDGTIGPGAAIDTDRFFVVCPNVLGGCQGTTGPSSTDARSEDARVGIALPAHHDPRPGRARSRRWPTRSASTAGTRVVGGSMGGMRVLEWAVGHPERVARAVGDLGRRAGDGRGDRAVQRADARHPRRPEVARRRLLRRGAR